MKLAAHSVVSGGEISKNQQKKWKIAEAVRFGINDSLAGPAKQAVAIGQRKAPEMSTKDSCRY